jgi:hypothetical protein
MLKAVLLCVAVIAGDAFTKSATTRPLSPALFVTGEFYLISSK